MLLGMTYEFCLGEANTTFLTHGVRIKVLIHVSQPVMELGWVHDTIKSGSVNCDTSHRLLIWPRLCIVLALIGSEGWDKDVLGCE